MLAFITVVPKLGSRTALIPSRGAGQVALAPGRTSGCLYLPGDRPIPDHDRSSRSKMIRYLQSVDDSNEHAWKLVYFYVYQASTIAPLLLIAR